MELLGLTSVPDWLLVTTGVIVAYVTYMSWNHLTFKRMGISGPPPLPVVGNLLTVLEKGFHGADVDWIEKYGKVIGVYATRIPMLLVSDDEMLKQIMVKDFNNFPNRQDLPQAMIGYPMDQSLVFSKDDHWRFVRNFMSPTFSIGKLKQMAPVVNRVGDRLVKLLKEKIAVNKEVEMKNYLEKFTMDVIAGTAFGMEVDALHNDEDPFVKNAKIILSNGLNSPYIIFITFFPFLIPIASMLGYHLFPESNLDFFAKVVKKILEERKNDPKSQQYSDFLQLMVNAEEETRQSHKNGKTVPDGQPVGLTPSEVVGAALLFFLAGYDTTASLMSFCVYSITVHPEVQERLVEEINTVLRDQEINFDNVQKLEYLDMCVNETLRLYPPAVRADRDCVKETEVKGVKIPQGMTIGIPIYAIHHDPDRWESPDQFNPERFSPENREKIGRFDFLPFGNGPRNCIGMRLALLEAKITLVKLFKNFKFSVSSKTQIPLKFSTAALLRPSEGVWVKIENR